MKRIFKLDLRVLVLEKGGVFTVEPLEIEGRITGPDKVEALGCLTMCIEGSLAVGEPLWREAPQNLVDLWNNRQPRQAGSVVQRFILKVRGQKDLLLTTALQENFS